MTQVIRNGYVLNGDASGFEKRDVFIQNGVIVPECSPEQSVDAEELYVLPGMIDIHTHGVHNQSFRLSSADWAYARRYMAARGVTAIVPTIRSMPLKDTFAAEELVSAQPERILCGSAVLGVHLEGPFISAGKSGAMTAPDETVSTEHLNEMISHAHGRLKVITIAPERENAAAFIAAGAARGIRMSMGHTLATLSEARTAIDAGAAGATHLFNAMRAFDHREPGILGAVLTDPRVTCEIIADFVHSSPVTVTVAYRLKGPDGLLLVSDSGEQTGLPDGVYIVENLKRIVSGNTCRNEKGNLAGSTCCLDTDAKNMCSLGIPLHEVSRMTSLNPAKAVGVSDRYGRIVPGCHADILLCSSAFDISRVFVGGQQVPPFI